MNNKGKLRPSKGKIYQFSNEVPIAIWSLAGTVLRRALFLVPILVLEGLLSTKISGFSSSWAERSVGPGGGRTTSIGPQRESPVEEVANGLREWGSWVDASGLVGSVWAAKGWRLGLYVWPRRKSTGWIGVGLVSATGKGACAAAFGLEEGLESWAHLLGCCWTGLEGWCPGRVQEKFHSLCFGNSGLESPKVVPHNRKIG